MAKALITSHGQRPLSPSLSPKVVPNFINGSKWYAFGIKLLAIVLRIYVSFFQYVTQERLTGLGYQMWAIL